MSGIIPMVSSSPPPMDDGGGFAAWDDDDDDDFGNFTGADSSFQTATTTAKLGDKKVPGSLSSSNDPKTDHGDFAEFSAFKSVGNEIDLSHDDNIDERPTDIALSKNDTSSNSDNKALNGQDNGPLTDSGLYSSEVSPVPQFEDIPGTSKSHTDTDSLDELSSDSSPRKTSSKQYEDKRINDQDEKQGNKIGDFVVYSGDLGDIDNGEDEDRSSKDKGCIRVDEQCNCVSDKVDTDADNKQKMCSANEQSENTDAFKKTEHGQNAIPGIDESSQFVENLGCAGSDTVIDENDNTLGQSISAMPYAKGEILESDSHSCDTGENGLEVKVEKQACEPHGELKQTIHDRVNDAADLSQKMAVNSLSAETNDFGDFIEKTVDDNVVKNSESLKSCDNKNDTDKICTDHIESSKTNSVSDIEQDINEDGLQNTQDIKVENKDGESDISASQENISELHQVSKLSDKSENNSNEQHLDSKGESDFTLSCDASKISRDSHSEDDNTNMKESAKGSNQCQDRDTESYDDNEDLATDKVSEDISETKGINEYDVISDNESDDFGDFATPNNEEDIILHSEENNKCEGLPAANNKHYVDEFSTLQKEEDDFGHFNVVSNNVKSNSGASDGFTSTNDVQSVPPDKDDFGDFREATVDAGTQEADDLTFKQPKLAPDEIGDTNDDEFGAFGEPDTDDFGDFGEAGNSGFADFGAASDTAVKKEEKDDGWASFSEPQTASETVAQADDDEDWSAFDDEAEVQKEALEAPAVQATPVPSPLQNMTKSEKVQYAVTTCFPAVLHQVSVDIIDLEAILDYTNTSRDQNIWVQIRDLKTTDAMEYQWAKSQWNSQLYSTLRIDTRNVLIGHKKAQVPIFASGLGLLEPTKGPVGGTTGVRPEVLVETSKPDVVPTPAQIHTHSTSRGTMKNDSIIPPAEFDWTGSGLTNPLEANNKTLNLDFLIQDQAAKSNALESEFLATIQPTNQKPAIQPLENILANLKSSSTFKPTNQSEDISQESLKIVQSLPDLSFMTSKVLMFPIRMTKN